VLETREVDEGTLIRRMRICANNHRFPTFELPGVFYSRVRKTLKPAIEGKIWKRRLAARDAEIRRLLFQGRSVAELAAQFELHVAQVRKIRRGKRS
jgi:hypothetical protein